MEKSLLDLIRRCVVSSRWLNNKAGKFEYLSELNAYRFLETTNDFNSFLVAPLERNEKNTPIVIKGFLSFLIDTWGQSKVGLYNSYNEKSKNKFINRELEKSGYYNRDFEKEFALNFLKKEQEYIQEFTRSFDYISQEEKDQILEYAKYYLEYTSKQYKQKLKKVTSIISFQQLLHHKNKLTLLKVLHELLDDTQGKQVAIVIKSLSKLGYLNIPSNRNELYRIMESEFGDIGTASNLNNYLNPDSRKLQDSDLDSIVAILKKV